MRCEVIPNIKCACTHLYTLVICYQALKGGHDPRLTLWWREAVWELSVLPKNKSPARGPFLEGPEMVSHPESRSKISNLTFTDLLFHIFVISTNVPFKTKSSGVHTSQFLHTDKSKMVLRARKVPRAFEKWAPGLKPGPLDPEASALTMKPPLWLVKIKLVKLTPCPVFIVCLHFRSSGHLRLWKLPLKQLGAVMYKLRQRKAAATFRVLFYEETTGTNESFNICSLALKREAICTAQSSLFQGSLSFASARESLATRLMGSYNSFKARNSCKLKTDDSQFTF